MIRLIMKKILIYLFFCLVFFSTSFAEEDKKFLNDYLKEGYDIVKLDIRDNKNVRIYTLEKRNSMVLCYIVIGSETSITNCYAP
jgi:hypothetical protein